jgi:hypothetical protein
VEDDECKPMRLSNTIAAAGREPPMAGSLQHRNSTAEPRNVRFFTDVERNHRVFLSFHSVPMLDNLAQTTFPGACHEKLVGGSDPDGGDCNLQRLDRPLNFPRRGRFRAGGAPRAERW